MLIYKYHPLCSTHKVVNHGTHHLRITKKKVEKDDKPINLHTHQYNKAQYTTA